MINKANKVHQFYAVWIHKMIKTTFCYYCDSGKKFEIIFNMFWSAIIIKINILSSI